MHKDHEHDENCQHNHQEELELVPAEKNEIYSPSKLDLQIEKNLIKSNEFGESPFGANRHFRRGLYTIVRKGKATNEEIEKFKSLGKEAYPWMNFKDEVIGGMIKRSLKK